MICPTCKELSLYGESDSLPGVCFRKRQCSCGTTDTVEIPIDNMVTLKAMAGGLYGAIKRLIEPEATKKPKSPESAAQSASEGDDGCDGDVEG